MFQTRTVAANDVPSVVSFWNLHKRNACDRLCHSVTYAIGMWMCELCPNWSKWKCWTACQHHPTWHRLAPVSVLSQILSINCYRSELCHRAAVK